MSKKAHSKTSHRAKAKAHPRRQRPPFGPPGLKLPTPINESGVLPRRKQSLEGPDELSILACSDCPVQDLRVLVEYVRSLEPRPDFVLFAGDGVESFRPRPELNLFKELAALTRYGLGAISGNGDPPPSRRLIAGKRVYDLHSHPVRIGRYWFVGLQGAPQVPNGVLMAGNVYSEIEAEDHLERHVPDLFGSEPEPRPVVILCSHAPPFGLADRSIRYGDSHVGSTGLSRFLFDEWHRRSVRLVVCGHSHYSGGSMDEWGGISVVNAASHDREGERLLVSSIHILPRSDPFTGRGLRPEVAVSWAALRGSWPAWGRPGLAPLHWEIGNLHRLRGVGDSRAAALEAAGFVGLRELAHASPEQVVAVRGALFMGTEEAERLPPRARAMIEARLIPLGRYSPPPGRRIYIDIETDLRQSWIWLIGCYDEGQEQLTQFGVRQPGPDAERQAMEQFAAYARERSDAVWCSYSNCALEERLVQGRLRHYRLPELPKGSMVDLYQGFHNAIAVPHDGTGIKALAAALGFPSRHPDLDGLMVASRYLARLGKDSDPIAPELLEYNADDVLCLHHVSKRLSELCDNFGV